MNTIRRKLYKRAEQPDGMRLTDRDRHILFKLWEYRFLSTSLLRYIAFAKSDGSGFSTLKNVRLRLRVLYDNGFVDRVPLPIFPGEAKPELCYTIGKQGVAYLDSLGLPVDSTSYPSGPKRIPAYLEHELLTAQFMVYLETALREYPRIVLKPLVNGRVWYHERTVANPASRNPYVKYLTRERVYDNAGRKSVDVKPDALFILRAQESGFERLFCVEIDRGSMGFKAILDKQLGYYHYLDRKLYHKYSEQLDGFRVLFVTTRSKHNLASLMKRMQSFKRGYDLFTFARVEELTPSSLLADQVWMLPTKEKVALVKG